MVKLSILKAEEVSYVYKSKYQTVEAVSDVSCTFDTGKVYAIVGHSGSGKSTFLSLLAGLDLPTEGEIYLEDKPMSTLDRDKYRRNTASAKELISKVGLEERIYNQLPLMMSGGEQQRVAIARALAVGGKILLADEPTGNLDTTNGNIVVELLRKLAHNEGYTVIIITHDMSISDRADVVYTMKDGKLTNKEREYS